MSNRIDIKYKVPDTRAKVKLRHLENIGFKGKVRSAGMMDSYVIDANLTRSQLRVVARMLENPLVEKATVNRPRVPTKFDWAVEIGYLPGVTDNVGATAKETIEDFLKTKFKNGQDVYPHTRTRSYFPDSAKRSSSFGVGVYSSQVFFFSGTLSEDDARRIADTLYNPLIQRAEIKSFNEFKKDGGMGIKIPNVSLRAKASADAVILEVSDDELARIGKEGIRNRDGSRRGPLALDLDSMRTIREYFRGRKRKPTDIELESLAQTWSEHCKHKIFANPIDEIKEGLYRFYIKAATNIIRKKKGKRDFCVSVFSDNSGAIAFDDKYLITHKVETHNSPSALDPFGGAITGILGVNRDTLGFGMAAKPVANVYGFCFADPHDASVLYRDAERKEKMLSARRIMEGVIQGVNTGGNCSGIPTPQGFMLFDKRYRGKPLVFAGTVGLIPRMTAGKPSHKKQARPGDYIVLVGGRVGRDGIHGATFSSEAMDSGSPATAVQIGDPITQKKMSDALVKEARDKRLYRSITDNGAGGLSCSVAEMARESGGCVVELEKVPLKYPGLAPWQIWISESQERMTLAVPKKKWRELRALLEKRGTEATVIGEFTSSGKCAVNYRGKKIMDLELQFLHDGWPRKQLVTKPITTTFDNDRRIPETRNIASSLKEMLKRPNIASYEFVSMQYDHEVQASSVLKPLQGRGRVNGDATALRPLLGSKRGIVLSSGIAPSYSEIDSYKMAACAIDTAIRAAVAAGADPDYLALLDNFCWCSSDEPERLFQLKQAARACYDYAVAYETPFISGKDSMFNDFKGYDENGKPIKISVPPTLLVSALGVIRDAANTISLDVKCAGDLIYVLGETYDELGGSEYAKFIGAEGGAVPSVDARKNRKLYRAFSECAREGIIASALNVSKGGLAVALCKMAMGGKLGLDVSFKNLPGKFSNDTAAFFSESQGRIIATVAPKHARRFEKIMAGTDFAKIGAVTKRETVVIRGKKRTAVLPVSEALRAYRSTFRNY